MSIREKLLIHSELKSDQVAILEKLVDHLEFLQVLYNEMRIIVWGKQGSAVIIFRRDYLKVINRDDIPEIVRGMGDAARQVPLQLGEEAEAGLLIFGEKNCGSTAGLEKIIDFCRQAEEAGFPDSYLVPDGLIVFDEQGTMRFKNGIGRIILRRLGLQDISLGRLVNSLGVGLEKYQKYLDQPSFIGEAYQVGAFDVSVIINPLIFRDCSLGALLIISDLTLIKKKEKELMEKSTVIKEIHHRVKNNLQTITSLLRLQMRRSNLKLVEKVFTESINRVLSIALIHEALSKQELEIINIKQTSYNILQMILSNMIDPSKRITGDIYGVDVYLSATLASSVSLCVTELIQNAVEHAFVNREEGVIRVTVEQPGDEVVITVEDNGVGLSPAKLQSESSLGMQIVNTIIQHNLKGSFSLEGHRYGTVACIRFPKTSMEGVEV